MFVKTLSIEAWRKHPELALYLCILEQSIQHCQNLLPLDTIQTNSSQRLALSMNSQDVMTHLTAKDTGGFFAWDGQAIPFNIANQTNY